MFELEDLQITALIALTIGVAVLAIVSGNHDKAQCLASGGHWIDGFVGGKYAYFCSK